MILTPDSTLIFQIKNTKAVFEKKNLILVIRVVKMCDKIHRNIYLKN